MGGNERIAFAADYVFLRLNGWRLQRAPSRSHAELVQMFGSGTFEVDHPDPWLRGIAVVAE